MRTVLGEITNTVDRSGTVKVREGEHQSGPSEADLFVIEECSAKILDVWNEFVNDLHDDGTSSWLRQLYELSGLPRNQRKERRNTPTFELESSESDDHEDLCLSATMQSATSSDEASLAETKLQVQSHTELREDGTQVARV